MGKKRQKITVIDPQQDFTSDSDTPLYVPESPEQREKLRKFVKRLKEEGKLEKD